MKQWVLLILGVVLYLFWAIPFRCALNFHEQFQLFLIDWDYFIEHLTRKGGLAVWISEALVQFYNCYWIGAAILTGELLLIQKISWLLLQKIFGKKHDWWLFILSLLLMFWVFIEIGDVNTMHSLLIAIIEELTFAYILVSIFKSKNLRCAVRYSLCVILLPIFVILYIWTAGPDHYRSNTQKFSFDNVFDRESYELVEYDYLVRASEWEEIIRKAEKKQPKAVMSICATNLALAMTNQLGNRIGDFQQCGRVGLVPEFSAESFSLLTTAEVYFQLGLANIAQRCYFEAMEGLPNGNKSCRCVRRLAETNLINGQYQVAKKYLRLLQKTVYYKLWAEKILKLIDSGEFAIYNHPQYEDPIRFRLREDFLFNEKEIDMVCGRLFVYNRANNMALQYMLAIPLLENDAEKLAKYIQVADKLLLHSPELDSFRKYIPQQKTE